MTTRNTFQQLLGTSLFAVIGRVTYATGTPSVGTLFGNPNMDPDITVADTAVGVATVTVNPFRGPAGNAVALACSNTISTFVSATALTYTGDSLAVEFSIEDDASAATDANFYFIILAN